MNFPDEAKKLLQEFPAIIKAVEEIESCNSQVLHQNEQGEAGIEHAKRAITRMGPGEIISAKRFADGYVPTVSLVRRRYELAIESLASAMIGALNSENGPEVHWFVKAVLPKLGSAVQ